jgi:hypothetical protein
MLETQNSLIIFKKGRELFENEKKFSQRKKSLVTEERAGRMQNFE